MASQKALLRSVVPIFVLLLSFPGCSTYQNVTAYFNTYYNAQKLFDDGVTELTRVPPAGKDTNYFVPVLAKSDGQSKFDKVIEKCSKIIQYYPESQLVDDAIVLIGESYVYMGEYESAIRKFKELLDNFPASDRRAETKLWYAKAQYYSEKEDDAVTLIEELVPEALDGGKNEIALEAVMLEAQIYFNRGDYQRSAEQYERAVKISGPRSMRSISEYQLGQSYERAGDNKKAAEAYLNVKEFKPDFDLRTRAMLRAGIMLVSIGQYDQALKLYRDLESEMYKPEELAPVELEIANAYAAMGDTARAFPLYSKIDTAYRRTDVAAKSYYQQASFYEKNSKDFKTAFDFYALAQNEFQASEVTAPAQKKTAIFTKLFTLQYNVPLYDTLLVASYHYDTAKVARDTATTLKDSSAAHVKSLSRFDSTMAQKALSSLTIPKTLQQDLAARAARPEKQFHSVRHRSRGHDDFDDDDDSEAWADSTSSMTAHVENISASAKLAYELSGNRTRLRQLRLASDTLRFLLTQSKFELGGLYMLDLKLPDSARAWFEYIVKDSISSSFTPRAMFSLAEIHRAKNDSNAVDSLHKEILKRYKNTAYGREVRRLKGGEESGEDVDSVEVEYANAQRSLQDGKTDDALRMLKKIHEQYPVSPLAPKVQYAVGWIYENVLGQNDSAAVWYRKLVKAYPTSLYALNAKPKVVVKENPDSLSKFVKINEVPTVGKENASEKGRGRLSKDQSKERQADQQVRRQRGKEEGVEEDNNEEQENQPELQDQPEQPDTTTTDDNNNRPYR